MTVPDKLSIAVKHLESAALLMAMDADVKSIHVLVWAADELIRSYAQRTNNTLAYDLYSLIKPEKRAEVKQAMNRAYNYFKHADRDAEQPYTGADPSQMRIANSLQLYVAYRNLQALSVDLSPFLTMSARLALLDHPEILSANAMDPAEKASLVEMVTKWKPEEIAGTRLAAWISDRRILKPHLSVALGITDDFERILAGC